MASENDRFSGSAAGDFWGGGWSSSKSSKKSQKTEFQTFNGSPQGDFWSNVPVDTAGYNRGNPTTLKNAIMNIAGASGGPTQNTIVNKNPWMDVQGVSRKAPNNTFIPYNPATLAQQSPVFKANADAINSNPNKFGIGKGDYRNAKQTSLWADLPLVEDTANFFGKALTYGLGAVPHAGELTAAEAKQTPGSREVKGKNGMSTYVGPNNRTQYETPKDALVNAALTAFALKNPFGKGISALGATEGIAGNALGRALTGKLSQEALGMGLTNTAANAISNLGTGDNLSFKQRIVNTINTTPEAFKGGVGAGLLSYGLGKANILKKSVGKNDQVVLDQIATHHDAGNIAKAEKLVPSIKNAELRDRVGQVLADTKAELAQKAKIAPEVIPPEVKAPVVAAEKTAATTQKSSGSPQVGDRVSYYTSVGEKTGTITKVPDLTKDRRIKGNGYKIKFDEPVQIGQRKPITETLINWRPGEDGLTILGSKNKASLPSEPTLQEPQMATSGAPEPLTPVGTGEVKKSRVGQSVQQKAVDEKLTQTLGDSPEYQQVNMKDQAVQATDLLAKDEARAVRIATGKEVPPAGVLPESVYVAVENKALKDKNIGLLQDLANSSRVTEATAMGQRIRALAERDPDSVVTRMRQVAEARMEAAGKMAKENVRQATSEVKAVVKKAQNTKYDWNAFVESIKC